MQGVPGTGTSESKSDGNSNPGQTIKNPQTIVFVMKLFIHNVGLCKQKQKINYMTSQLPFFTSLSKSIQMKFSQGQI